MSHFLSQSLKQGVAFLPAPSMHFEQASKQQESRVTLCNMAAVHFKSNACVAVHLGVKMDDTLRFTAKVDMVDF